MNNKYIVINGKLYKEVESFEDDICPFCGGKDFIIHPEDETFKKRKGCLNCNKWLDPVRFIND